MTGYLSELKAMKKDQLINELYNRAIGDMCNDVELQKDVDNEKPIPYMGWFWRDIWVAPEPRIIIATDGKYIAVCQSNKWGYDQRRMTSDEAAMFIGFIDNACRHWKTEERLPILRELRQWMQTLKI